MNNLARREFHFHNAVLTPIQDREEIWFTSSDLAKALGYASTKSISNLYAGNSEEFSDSMTMVIGVMTNGINNNLREKKVRIFSLRGAHLIAMFARTGVAKEFRRWVLDILDREVQHSPIVKQFTDEEIVHLCYTQLWMEKAQRMSKALHPAMKQIGSDFSGTLYDMAHETRYFTVESRKALLREAEKLDMNNRVVMNALPMFNLLRSKEIH